MHQPLAYIHSDADIARNVVIEPFVTIEKNVEIGNATIRSPEYEIISAKQNSSNGNFEVKVLAKKLKNDHFDEVANTIEIDDTAELMRFLNK